MPKPDRAQPDRFGVGAILVYLGLSAVFFARALPGAFSSIHIGKGPDCALYMWYMVWWPHAIRHHLNPFFTDLLWVPWGFNIAWSTCVTLQSMVASPLTATFGPVFAFNVLSLTFPALDAWAAYLLCRHLVRRYSVALLGGYIYGFSPYILGQQAIGHIHMTAAFIVPLFLYLALRYLDGSLARIRFVALMAALLVLQFLAGTEIFATSLFFGAIAVAVAMTIVPQSRPRLFDLIRSISLSLGIAIVVLSPFIYYILRAGPFGAPFWRAISFSVDTANTVIPGSTLLLGQVLGLERVDDWMLQGFVENGSGYIGLPLIAIAIAFGYSRWRDPVGRLISLMVAIVYLLCLGPRLHFGGRTLFGLPWKLFEHLPLLNNALPNRFAMYLFLGLAIATVLWFEVPTLSLTKQLAVAIITVMFLLPNLSSSYWLSDWRLPEFFANGDYAKYLAPKEVIIPLPYSGGGEDMLWQASSDMYFAMAGGRLPKPREYQSWPILLTFNGISIPDVGDQLQTFMAAHHATTIILSDDATVRPLWLSIMHPLGIPPVEVGGVSLFHIPSASLAKYQGWSGPRMEARMDATRFEALLTAANRYVIGHPDLKALTPLEVARLGLLPEDWVSPSDEGVSTHSGLWLEPWSDGQVAVGLVGSYEPLKPLIEKYSTDATGIYFPYPRKLEGPPRGDTFMRKLVMTFDAKGLARAAAKSSAPSSNAAH